MNQIQIMWVFWLKLYSHQTILAFKGHEGHATVKQPLLHALPLNFWNQIMILGHKRHNLVVVSYGQIWEKYKWFGLFWPFWPLKTKFFHWIQFYVILSLRFKFGTILMAGSRENCSQGRKLIWRLLAFEGRFSKNNFEFLTHFV